MEVGGFERVLARDRALLLVILAVLTLSCWYEEFTYRDPLTPADFDLRGKRGFATDFAYSS